MSQEESTNNAQEKGENPCWQSTDAEEGWNRLVYTRARSVGFARNSSGVTPARVSLIMRTLTDAEQTESVISTPSSPPLSQHRH